jgi:hypothetical protein
VRSLCICYGFFLTLVSRRDYTHGTIDTIVYALPVVEEVASNCLLNLNTGIWADDDEFIHT